MAATINRNMPYAKSSGSKGQDEMEEEEEDEEVKTTSMDGDPPYHKDEQPTTPMDDRSEPSQYATPYDPDLQLHSIIKDSSHSSPQRQQHNHQASSINASPGTASSGGAGEHT